MTPFQPTFTNTHQIKPAILIDIASRRWHTLSIASCRRNHREKPTATTKTDTKLSVQRDGKGKIFSHVRQKWLVETPEESVRQEFLCVLVNEYGYSLNQIAEEEQVIGRGSAKARADHVIWRTADDKKHKNAPLIIIECKSDNITISEVDYFLALVAFNRVGGVKQRMYYANLAEIRLPEIPVEVQKNFANQQQEILANITVANEKLAQRKKEIEKMILGTHQVEAH